MRKTNKSLLKIKINILNALFLAFLTISTPATASKDKCPTINQGTLVGVWEAVYTEDTIRVFRLEVFENGKGVLSQGLGNGRSTSSTLDHIFIKNDKVKLFFTNNHGGIEYIYNDKNYVKKGEDLLIGTGNACKNQGGVLETELQMEPNLPEPKKWKLRFIKYEENKTLTEQISKMASDAKSAANNSN